MDWEALQGDFQEHWAGILTICKLITQSHSINGTRTLYLWEKAGESRGHVEFTTAAVSFPFAASSPSFCPNKLIMFNDKTEQHIHMLSA